MLSTLQIFSYHIHLYPMMFGLALGVLLFKVHEESGVKSLREFLWILSITVVAFLGGRLFYVFFSKGELSFQLGGGLVILGAIIPGFIWLKTSADILKIDKQRFTRSIPYIPLAHGIGRLGCFFAGCCFGKEIAGLNFPVQLAESLFLFFLFWELKRHTEKHFIFVKDRYLLFYGLFRFVIEFFRADEIRGIHYGLSTSQWLALVIFIYLFVKKIILRQELQLPQ